MTDETQRSSIIPEAEKYFLIEGKTEKETNDIMAEVADFDFDEKGNVKNSSINYQAVAEITAKEFSSCVFNRTLYIYNRRRKIHEEDKGVVDEFVQNIIDTAVCNGFIKKSKIKGVKSEIQSRVMSKNVIKEVISPFNKFNGIPVGNGVLVFNDNIGVFELIDYKPDMLLTRRISTNYNPEADTEHITNILKMWVGGDDYPYLIQIAAQALLQSLPKMQPLKKAYLIKGEANGGKSTFLEFLESVFGEPNVANIPLQKLEDRFVGAMLEGTYVNLGDDIPPDTLKYASTFKTFVGKRTQNVERKGKDIYPTEITAVHVYTCNRPPETNDALRRDDAFWSRWIILNFPYYFSSVSGWKEQNLTEEVREGYLLLAVRMVEDMIKNGCKISKVQELDEVMYTWQRDSSPLGDFLEKNTQQVFKGYILKDELMDAVTDYADSLPQYNGDKTKLPNNQNALTRKMQGLGYSTGRTSLKKPNGKTYQPYTFEGLEWKPDSPYRKTETKNSQIV